MKKRSLDAAASHVAATQGILGQDKLGMAFRRGLRSQAAMLSTFERTRRERKQFAPAALLLAVLVFLALLVGCSSEPSKPAESAKPEAKGPELLTGRSAFQKMFIAARGWARDAQPYRIESTPTSDANGRDGKSAIWHAFFASPSQRGAKPFIWSGSAAENAPSRGVSPGNEDNYSPSNSSTQIFDSAFLKIDSDQAFATAQKHGGDKILEKSPDTPVIYSCDWNHNTNELVWHVIYGSGRDQSKLTVAINASTGEFIRVEK
jgi:hypothetical protein